MPFQIQKMSALKCAKEHMRTSMVLERGQLQEKRGRLKINNNWPSFSLRSFLPQVPLLRVNLLSMYGWPNSTCRLIKPRALTVSRARPFSGEPYSPTHSVFTFVPSGPRSSALYPRFTRFTGACFWPFP